MDGAGNIIADALSRRPDFVVGGVNLVEHSLTPQIQTLFTTYTDAEQRQLQQLKEAVIAKHASVAQQPLSVVNGELYWDGRRYVLPTNRRLVTALMAECHDCHGHLGVTKSTELLQRSFYWPRMVSSMTQYIKSCQVCQEDKARNQSPPGLLFSHNVPNKRWHTITLDFITGLPITKNGNDAIAVFVDKLTKMVHYAPTTTTVTAARGARLLIDR